MSGMHSETQRHTRASVSGDVRAGPGDAGAADAPRELPKSDQYERRSRYAGRFTLAVIAVGILVAIISWALA
ncbi:hypothetical protein KUV65_10745 [Maritalea mobilis]|uniref:hypothetical protein n=1 Tax=Maritalea mobilis TaxID=483324 RepID=UPI001C9670CE|nr:hypothetical protein [Maritalea mobilis]MBY6201842.1 hypothetical protein [Maritalea mobilis]